MALTNGRLISALPNWNALYWHVWEIGSFSHLWHMVDQQGKALCDESCARCYIFPKSTQYGLAFLLWLTVKW